MAQWLFWKNFRSWATELHIIVQINVHKNVTFNFLWTSFNQDFPFPHMHCVEWVSPPPPKRIVGFWKAPLLVVVIPTCNASCKKDFGSVNFLCINKQQYATSNSHISLYIKLHSEVTLCACRLSALCDGRLWASGLMCCPSPVAHVMNAAFQCNIFIWRIAAWFFLCGFLVIIHLYSGTWALLMCWMNLGLMSNIKEGLLFNSSNKRWVWPITSPDYYSTFHYLHCTPQHGSSLCKLFTCVILC